MVCGLTQFMFRRNVLWNFIWTRGNAGREIQVWLLPYIFLTLTLIDWFDLLAVQGTLKSLLQHHSSKASILWRSAFFMVQLSHPYMTNGKTKALTRWTFVGKVMSPLFNMLSRLVIALLPRSKHLLISWLQSPSAWFWRPPKIKSVSVSIVSPYICHEVMGLDAMILVFWMLNFKPTFSLSTFTFIKRLFRSSSLDSRQCIKKQRHYFAYKGPYSQSYGFVQM